MSNLSLLQEVSGYAACSKTDGQTQRIGQAAIHSPRLHVSVLGRSRFPSFLKLNTESLLNG